jgi:hypothetical protein
MRTHQMRIQINAPNAPNATLGKPGVAGLPHLSICVQVGFILWFVYSEQRSKGVKGPFLMPVTAY